MPLPSVEENQLIDVVKTDIAKQYLRENQLLKEKFGINHIISNRFILHFRLLDFRPKISRYFGVYALWYYAQKVYEHNQQPLHSATLPLLHRHCILKQSALLLQD